MIDYRRYALYSHPYTEDKQGRTEVCCLECRDSDLPLVIWEGSRTAFTFVLQAVKLHELEIHPKNRNPANKLSA